MDEFNLELYWSELPVGKENAVDYSTLMNSWGMSERAVRNTLHELSSFDNGDNYILIRSSQVKGFYKTDNVKTIEAYKKECLNKGKSVFAPVKKINRVLKSEAIQISFENNLKFYREANNLKQNDVVKRIRPLDNAFDKSMLSKMENGVCLPTPFQLVKIAEIYSCKPTDLINSSLYY